MSVEIAWKQNILVTDFHLLKSLLVVLGFGSQAFICGFSRQNINSVCDRKNVTGIVIVPNGTIVLLIFYYEHLNLRWKNSVTNHQMSK